MGWNVGYTIIENTVVTLYDEGVLNKDILEKFIDPFIGCDVDHGGEMGLKAKDGLNADAIICKIMNPEGYKNAIENPVLEDNTSEEDKNLAIFSVWENNALSEVFDQIWYKDWGMY